MIIESGKYYYWATDEPHSDNIETMNDFLDVELKYIITEEHEVIFFDGTYAEIKLSNGRVFEVHASGNGDFYNHKVCFVEVESYSFYI